jgi:hypothetical protein
MQNVLLAFELSLEGRDLKGASANQGSMAILNIHCMFINSCSAIQGTFFFFGFYDE